MSQRILRHGKPFVCKQLHWRGGKVFGYDLVHIACCNDGVRPVIFRLEAYEDDEKTAFEGL